MSVRVRKRPPMADLFLHYGSPVSVILFEKCQGPFDARGRVPIYLYVHIYIHIYIYIYTDTDIKNNL